jgi:hypothetical protein
LFSEVTFSVFFGSVYFISVLACTQTHASCLLIGYEVGQLSSTQLLTYHVYGCAFASSSGLYDYLLLSAVTKVFPEITAFPFSIT